MSAGHHAPLGVLVLASAMTLGCQPEPAVTVEMVDGNAFEPASVTVTEGTTVHWRNTSAGGHTSTSEDWDSGEVRVAEVFSHTFADAGTYRYHCEIHEGMTGVVVVEE